MRDQANHTVQKRSIIGICSVVSFYLLLTTFKFFGGQKVVCKLFGSSKKLDIANIKKVQILN